MRKYIFLIIFIFTLGTIYADWSSIIKPPKTEGGNPVIILPDGTVLPDLDEEIPDLPFIPTVRETLEEEDGYRILEKTFTVMLQAKVKIFVPLEVLSDIDLKATVIDNQEITVPFDIVFNRNLTEQEKTIYTLNFSETEIDIDGDGNIDTKIFYPKNLNIDGDVLTENYVVIEGSKITNEGKHKKTVYITVNVPDEADENQYL